MTKRFSRTFLLAVFLFFAALFGTMVIAEPVQAKSYSWKVQLFKGGKRKCRHQWGYTTTKRATCTTDGKEKRTCNKCGRVENRNTERLGHSWSIVAKDSGTITYFDGQPCKKYKCSRCKKEQWMQVKRK